MWVDNENAGILPDRTTALMAAQVVQLLVRFGRAAGLTEAELFPAEPDLSRFLKLDRDRDRETKARRARAKRRPRR